MVFLGPGIREFMMLTWLMAVTGDGNSHCLVQAVPTGFLQTKVFILSFVVNKYLWRDSQDYKNHVSPETFTH